MALLWKNCCQKFKLPTYPKRNKQIGCYILNKKIIAVSGFPIKQYFANRDFSTLKKSDLVLGIESSCDDTGAAVVDQDGNILGEGFYSQLPLVIKLGGVLGPLASREHALHIRQVVNDAIDQAKIKFTDLSAIAATNEPGFKQSLRVGCGYGQRLALHYNKPFIPIHHMQAHALTVRMTHKVDFPFVVLLVSGGHCLITLVKSLDEWVIIGQTRDMAPGNIFDKVARRLKLKNIPITANMSGGKAIQTMAEQGNVNKEIFGSPMSKHYDCDFSFSGFLSEAFYYIGNLEKEKGCQGGDVLEEAADICASFQHSVIKHICRRTQRALVYCKEKNLLPLDNLNLVVSGGVACNKHLSNELEKLANKLEFKFFCPPPKLCTDNGIMIAWNGMERLKANSGVLHDPNDINNVKILPKSPLGPCVKEDVIESNIRLTKFWINK